MKFQGPDPERRTGKEEIVLVGPGSAGVAVMAPPPDLKGVSWWTSAQLNSLGSQVPCVLRLEIG